MGNEDSRAQGVRRAFWPKLAGNLARLPFAEDVVAAYYCAVKTLKDAGVRLKGDVILTYVVGELQGGVGTLAMIKHGVRADYFINSEPTDLLALTMHAAAFTFIIELTGITRHL